MIENLHKQRGQLSDQRDKELIDGDLQLDEATEYFPLHLSKKTFFWEEVLAVVLLGYAGLAFLKVFKVLEHSHISMAVGPAIFGVTGLLGTFTLYRVSRRKRALRETDQGGRYRLGLFLLEDRILINIPRLLRSIPYELISGVRLNATFQGQESDSLCIEYQQGKAPHTIRMRETFSCSRNELETHIRNRLVDQG